MRGSTLLLLLLVLSVGSAGAAQPRGDFHLYLIRHAEKQADDGKDPGLTDAGRFRAHQLVKLFRYRDIERTWSTDYTRTRDTAAPLVAALKLEMKIYDPHDLPVLTRLLLEDRKNALVVGHSNTTPDLARLLCQCDIGNMDDSEYDLLYVVTVSGDETSVEILKQSSLWERWVRNR